MKVAVIYLFRKGDSNGEQTQFLQSYHNHKAGWSHDLFVFYKGLDYKYHYYNVINFGRDLFSYWLIAHKLKHYDYLVFFNSHTEIICGNWLHEMMVHSCHGLVGTSCSQESFYTNAKRRFSFVNWLRKLLYDETPNYHIRTNGFLINRELMLKIWPCWLIIKQLCYLFESGKNNLTRRCYKEGYKTYVVHGLIRDNMISKNKNVT